MNKRALQFLALCISLVVTHASDAKKSTEEKKRFDISHTQRANMDHNSKADLLAKLFEIDAIKEGEFTLASGIVSPVYIDLRRIISFPDVYQHVVDLLWDAIEDKHAHHVGGVPYAALPLASGVALLYRKSMLMPRKEVKDHGAGRTIEGVYKSGDTIVMLEDVVTSGGSILAAIDALEKEGLIVKEVVCFMDREQGAAQKLAERGIALRAVCTLSQAMDALRQAGKIDEAAVSRIATFIQQNQF